MSDVLITSLQQRINELQTENATIKAEAKDRRLKAKGLTGELETLRKQVTDLTAERDQVRQKAEAGPTEFTARIAELEGQLRTRDHRDAFSGVKDFETVGPDGKPAKYRLNDGVKPEAIWQLTGYKAEGETPDAATVTTRYAEALQAHPYLFAAASPETGTTAPGGATRPITVQPRESGPGGRTSMSNNTLPPSATAQVEASHGNRPAGRIA